MNKNDLKQSIINDLKYISFNTNETEFYDMLMYVFETLNKFNLIDNESYDEIENQIAEIWGFNINSI